MHSAPAPQKFAAPLAARLIVGERPVDVISPAGFASSLCSLAPATSENAKRQLFTASGIRCEHFRDYSPTGIWLQQGAKYDPEVLRALRLHAAVFQGQPPFNAAIAEWSQSHGNVPIHIDQPIKFASVSALAYSTTWEFVVLRSASRSARFYGRDRSSTVTFISGIGATVQREAACERTSISLEFGGTLRLSKVSHGRVDTALSCLTLSYLRSRIVDARFVLPRISVSGQSDFTQAFKRLGASDIFTGSKNPFPRLSPGLALDKILQSTEFRIDEAGVGVRASTAAYAELGIPHPKLQVSFNVPFVFEVLDGRRAPVALGLINDL